MPAVFVLFVRLWEWDSDGKSTVSETPRSPLETPTDREERELRDTREVRQAVERQHDSVLAKEIAERKRATSDRGIKLTVVLMATRTMLGPYLIRPRVSFL